MSISDYRKDFMVYIVDDEESIREVLREALQTAGYQVETFSSAEDGLARVQESPPHLIFSDIRMPGMNGIQFLEKVKDQSQEIEFIIMTSHASLETAVNAIKLGAYDYIFKPFEAAANESISQENHEIQLINIFMQKFSRNLEPDQVTQLLIEAISQVIGNKPVIFFKYMAHFSSLITSQTSLIPLSKKSRIWGLISPSLKPPRFRKCSLSRQNCRSLKS
jgi:YesN/AraC family two-component response regulator